MNSSSDTAGFQIIGARKQLYVVPPWHTHHTSEESCTVLYLVSSPLPSDVSSVVFNITTRNQGWHSNPRDGIWSWFEVSILSSWQQNAMPKLDDLMKPTYVQPCPDDFGEYLQEQGLYFKEIPSKIAASSSGISISLSDTSMRRSWVEMVHIYGKDDNAKGGSFLPILEEGDRLVIWARTKFAGWVNYIDQACILISTSPIPLSWTVKQDLLLPSNQVKGLITGTNSMTNVDLIKFVSDLIKLRHPQPITRRSVQSDSTRSQAVINHPDVEGESVRRKHTSSDQTPKRDEPDRSSQQQDEQISHLESVLSHMCSDDSRKPDVLSSLGFGYMFRYKRSSKKEDIEKSLDLHRLAMEQEPENREFRARFVLALLDRYSGFHDSADIDLAIVELEKTIPLPLDFPQRQGYLESFANAYRSRHRDTGNEGDIQRLIQLYKEIETTFPDDSVEKAIYTGQRMKYDETVSIEERDIALRQMEDALIPTPAHLQQYQVLLRLLSKQYYARWELTGDSKDLELAISKAKDHVSALPENDVSVSSAAVYEFLGHLLRKKGLRSENTAELMAACEQMEKALDAAPPNSIYRDLMVIKRAEYLAMLPFESKRREALLRTAVEKCDYLHTTWFNRLSNPAKSSLLMFISWHYYNLYVFTKHPADLEQALQYVEGKSDLESIEGGVDKTLLRWKGEMWLVKANETRVTDGTATRRGMQYLLQSSASDSSLPRERVLSAESIIRRANRTGSWELASKAADQIFPLLPLITSRDLSNEDKIYTLQDISTIASNACAAILMFRPPMEALLKLEVGRGIVMGDLINNSSDLSGLHQAHPDLAQEYERLRLQAFHSLKHEKWETGQTQLLNERRIVFQQLQQCERQIRAKAGFEGFLHPMNIRQMVDCAREGPIIVVNITCTSSDAIFVLSPTIIGHHRLNSMITRAVDKFREYLMRHAMTELYGDPWSYEKDPGARDLDSDLPREAYDNNLLSWLWYTCVKPILTSLASDGHISSGEEKSRVWWIGTGAAAGLPFHAAGDYSQSQENKGESCLDHVISSYTPTIKALHAVRAKAAAQQASRRVKERPSLLVATMPDTPGYGALHGVRREAQGISDAVGQSMEVKQLISPSTDEVLSQLQDCDLVHFACHGHSDPGNPANSHLLLQKHSDTGMVVDKLTVSKLLDTQTISRAWIAYLSACSTAEIRDRRLLDEGLHITSGFLMAGFTHVIGSLWPAEDEVCVHMATYFYKALITRYATATDLNRAVAEAVHDATLQIRRQYWHSPLSWALYTHVGA
ncbi:CHAT domain-domain-containing protein [Aspergillus welwitschiae]|uniref:CHAT domain-domain-containing protein n=1 Tax=Aspergillus welwitschiae TaxID=1341132 RepID=A0A3F3QAR6_9EURO|nr:CHAT domain-domain-containing protein [Aspergillus welwitschiae]RDH36157.1 CHAT domain-domain-containing protein [Aspergillus welwitschiae]